MEGKATHYKKKKKSGKKHRIMFWLLLLLLAIGIALLCAVISYNYIMRNYAVAEDKQMPVIDPKDGVEFIVERGAGTSEIAKNLKDQGFIKDEGVFKFLSKINGFDGTYQSGTHILRKDLSYDEIMRILSSVPASRQVTIPEGKTFRQIVDILFGKGVIKDRERFVKTANTGNFNYDFLKELPPRKDRLEGYLFPDTYEFDMNASDEVIIKKMLDNFDRKFKPEYREKVKTLKDMNIDKIVILASMIEKEAKNPDDRYLISGVLYNRLNSKDRALRKLQVDATIQYIIFKTTGAYKDKLSYDDLEIDDLYNTYKYEGLPPGPICCPGEAAIKAALNPDTEDGYLYYVARGDAEGSHEFSKTFKDHQAAIKKYSREK